MLSHTGSVTAQSMAKLKAFGDNKNGTGSASGSHGNNTILPSMMSLNLTNNNQQPIGLLPMPRTTKMNPLAYSKKFCPTNQGKIKNV